MNAVDVGMKVQNILTEQLGIDESEVQLTSTLCEDLGADSLDTIEVMMAIEEEFGVEITDDEANKVIDASDANQHKGGTVADVIKLTVDKIERKLTVAKIERKGKRN